MTLILVEGVDRAGKTTHVKALMRAPRTKPRLKLHFDAPGDNGSERVLDEMWLAFELADKMPHVDFVWDRGWLSWFIYEGMYRDAQKGTLANMRRWEDALAMLYRHVTVEVHLVQANVDTVLLRDDGASTWTRQHADSTTDFGSSRAALVRETDLFREAWEKSRWRKTAVDTTPKAVPA